MPNVLGSSACMSLERDENLDEGVKFHLTADLFTFRDLEFICSELGAVATPVDDFKQHDMIAKLMNQFGKDEAWIGLFDPTAGNVGSITSTDRFIWADGSNFNFGTTGGEFPWLPGFPGNVAEGAEEADCTIISRNFDDGGFGWRDVNCEAAIKGVCRSFCSVSAELQSNSGPDLDLFMMIGVAAAAVGLLGVIGSVFVMKKRKQQNLENETMINNLQPIDQTKHLNELTHANANRPSGVGYSLRSAFSKFSFRSSTSSFNPPLAETNPLAKKLKDLDQKRQVRGAGQAPDTILDAIEVSEDML